MKSDRQCRQAGFTLLEVLVALVIVGLGLAAVFGQLNQSVSTTARLRDKTLAGWIAADRMAELRISGDFPKPGSRSDGLEMASADWTYTIKTTQTPIENIRRIDVSVSHADDPGNILATLVGFVGKPAVSSGQPAATQGDFPVFDEELSEGLVQ